MKEILTRESAEAKLRLVPDLDMEHPFIGEVLDDIAALCAALAKAGSHCRELYEESLAMARHHKTEIDALTERVAELGALIAEWRMAEDADDVDRLCRAEAALRAGKARAAKAKTGKP